MTHAHPLLLWDVEEEHLDEAEFCLETWEASLDSADYTLSEIAEGPEDRLLAHIDALVLAGPAIVADLLRPVCEAGEEPTRVTAAALALLEDPQELRERGWLFALLGGEEPTRRRAIGRAFELTQTRAAEAALIDWLPSAPPLVVAEILTVLAHRQVRTVPELGSYLASEDLTILRSATKAAKSAGASEVAALGRLVHHADPEVQQAVTEAALLNRVGGALALANYWAFEPQCGFRRDAMAWVASIGGPDIHARLIGLLGADPRRTDALWALGFAGTVAALEAASACLCGDTGPVAADVLCTIAGMPHGQADLWQVEIDDPDGALPPLEDDPLGAPATSPDLPAPNVEGVSAWWAAQRGRFHSGTRYLGGELASGTTMAAALLHHGAAHRRHGWALESACRTAGVVMIPSRVLAKTQRGLASAAGFEADWQHAVLT